MVGMLVADSQTGQKAAERGRSNAAKGRGIVLVQYTEHLGGGEPLAFLVGTGQAIAAVENVFQGRTAIE